ncbi:MAG: transglycosylase SLT domain-containing protein [Bacteroidales bacterium]|nr:transglycosylase SLT domain-containing protein [Bacteroidales bacterium]
MSNSKSRHLAGCIVLSLILVSLAGIQPMLKVADTAEDYRLDKDTLHCAVALAGHLAASEGRGTGLSNEMLQYFGDFASATVEIVPGNSSLSYLDSLKEHKIDILVLDHPDDNIPEDMEDSCYVSHTIRNNIHWVISSADPTLLSMINVWLEDFMGSRLYKRTVARQYRTYSKPRINPATGEVSPFDEIIKRYSALTGIDWLLLASLMYQESQYYVGAEYKEAKGLMQVTDVTAARYGVSDLFSPEGNIKAGSLYLKYLMNKYYQEGLDSLNVIKFALASYNAGDGRIEQCRNHALSEGKNPNDWEEVVTTFATNNKFIGKTTTAYVRDILARWEDLKETVPVKK